jgi:hypothetical protein
MADPEGSYIQVPSEFGEGSEHAAVSSGARRGRWVAVLLGAGSGLLLCCFLAAAQTGGRPADGATSTRLFGSSYVKNAVPVASVPKIAFSPATARKPVPAPNGNSLRQGFNPSGRDLPYYRPRSEILAPPRGFFDNFGRDSWLYGGKTYEVGEPVEYFSQSRSGWISATITAVDDEEGAVQIDAKPGFWITKKEQGNQMRKKTVNKGIARPDRPL